MSNMEKCGQSKSDQTDQKLDDNKRNHPANKRDEKLITELKAHIPDVENIFNVHRRIGEGTFSTVFLATLKCHENISPIKRKLFAVKYLIPTSHPNRIERELKCLLEIGGVDNIVNVELCLRRKDSVAFVMPYVPHDKFHNYFHKLDARELQDYMRNLLVALRRVHSFGIIHRDVKPSNFLHDQKNQKYLLVDFGLAQNIIRKDDSTNMLGETSNDKKRKASEIEETENCYGLSSAPKRARTQYSQQGQSQQQQQLQTPLPSLLSPPQQERPPSQHQQQQQQSSAVVAAGASDENASQRRLLNSSIPPPPFKSPLKEVNELSPPKNTFKTAGLDAPLTRHIKSAVLGFSIKSKMENQRSSSNPTAVNPTKYTTDNRRSNNNVACYCYGKSTVCNLCLVKKEIQASRAGTPGYRPPEVLLKHPNQSTAVDMWAIGVIMISILSACYPFFKASDDYNALAEITTVFGDEIIKKTALSMSRNVCISPKKRPLHLRKLCIRLRNRTSYSGSATTTTPPPTEDKKHLLKICDNCQQKLYECLCEDSDLNMDFSSDIYPASAYDLMAKLLTIDPINRITAADALEHPFLKENL